MAKANPEVSNTVEPKEVKEVKPVEKIKCVLNIKTGRILYSNQFENKKTFESYLKNKKSFKELPMVEGKAVLEVENKQDYIEIQQKIVEAKEQEIAKLKEQLAAAEKK
jgi:hypothetical protein